jgi:hypothetical protein
MFKWFRDISGWAWDIRVLAGRIEGLAGRIEGRVHDISHDVFNINDRGAGHARKINCLVDSVKNIQDAVRELAEAKKEDELGPFQYEISASDLFELSQFDRSVVCRSGARFLNDICAVSLANVGSIGITAAKRIMEWRRKCVMRITEEQIDEAISAVQRGGN